MSDRIKSACRILLRQFSWATQRRWTFIAELYASSEAITRYAMNAEIAGDSQSPLLRVPMRSIFLSQDKEPRASDAFDIRPRLVRSYSKKTNERLDEERFAGFNQSADRST